MRLHRYSSVAFKVLTLNTPFDDLNKFGDLKKINFHVFSAALEDSDLSEYEDARSLGLINDLWSLIQD